MDELKELDFAEINDHFYTRIEVHQRIKDLFQKLEDFEDKKYFTEFILGLHDVHANYSANSPHLHVGGETIIKGNLISVYDRVIALVHCLLNSETDELRDVLFRRNPLFGLGISIGSEIACMLKPDTFWVTNIRTVYTEAYLRTGSIELANELIGLYRGGRQSEIDYNIWVKLHPFVGEKLRELITHIETTYIPKEQKQYPYLYVDCIASSLFDTFSDE